MPIKTMTFAIIITTTTISTTVATSIEFQNELFKKEKINTGCHNSCEFYKSVASSRNTCKKFCY